MLICIYSQCSCKYFYYKSFCCNVRKITILTSSYVMRLTIYIYSRHFCKYFYGNFSEIIKKTQYFIVIVNILHGCGNIHVVIIQVFWSYKYFLLTRKSIYLPHRGRRK